MDRNSDNLKCSKIPIPRYTEGEWYHEGNLGCKDIHVRISEGNDVEIVTIDNQDIGYSHGMWCEAEDLSNVDLICAAPKMLEFIKKQAETGNLESIEFLKQTFVSRTCDECDARFVCYTEEKTFRHSNSLEE